MHNSVSHAPGWPGIPPKWTSSSKSGVGTALSEVSRVWFTIGYGILNEVYYPRVDRACTRDMGLIVTDGQDFFSEEKRDTHHEVDLPYPGVPIYRLVNTCNRGRYRVEKWVVADPRRDVVLQKISLASLEDMPSGLRLYVLLAPHVDNRGSDNTAWLGEHKGVEMLFASGRASTLALASSTPWIARSVGFVGVSDGWQELNADKRLSTAYDRAENGNVALTGELTLPDDGTEVVLVLGFGQSAEEAGHRALASLQDGFQAACARSVEEWKGWHAKLVALGGASETQANANFFDTSMMVLRVHESKRFPGGSIASLSIPWGASKGDDDLGGYHLVWPRDLVESVGGLLAAGSREPVRQAIHYLQATQEADGHWPQNMWLDGTAYWGGVQMDETAFPILLVDLALREGALDEDDRDRLWPMIRKAASYLVRNGPVTAQDRWEEDPGYSPFTLAVEIAALLVAAEHAERRGAENEAAYLRETADFWNDRIEAWTYATGTDLAHRLGVSGYYVRIAAPETADASSPLGGFVPIKNRPLTDSLRAETLTVSPDALALVRFGLRAPDDERVRNTVKVIDALLRVDTPLGPCWHRYNDDGYGEHEDGSPFDGTGVGRAWPLLTGERAHYELAAGNPGEAQRLRLAVERFANEGGMIPEQIWDAADIPERLLFRGRPSGSAMPLVWAHAEYVKLLRSLAEGWVFDQPRQTTERYLRQRTESLFYQWRFNHKCRTMPGGRTLRVEALAPARVHWSADAWAMVSDEPTRETGLGVYVADLPTSQLPAGAEIVFTFYWLDENRWEGTDYTVVVDADSSPSEVR
ncbi:MAG: glucan 1,4-alpha-glucosidase [Gemmatimonadales bacterium]|jgi:glucoamylase